MQDSVARDAIQASSDGNGAMFWSITVGQDSRGGEAYGASNKGKNDALQE